MSRSISSSSSLMKSASLMICMTSGRNRSGSALICSLSASWSSNDSGSSRLGSSPGGSGGGLGEGGGRRWVGGAEDAEGS